MHISSTTSYIFYLSDLICHTRNNMRGMQQEKRKMGVMSWDEVTYKFEAFSIFT